MSNSSRPLGFDNLVDALAAARKEGYTYDFNIKGEELDCSALGKCFGLEALTVDRVAHVEGMDSSPDSRSKVYFISSSSGEQGVLVEPDPAYLEAAEMRVLERLQMGSK